MLEKGPRLFILKCRLPGVEELKTIKNIKWLTLAPIWLPHWPACIWTISLMLNLSYFFQLVFVLISGNVSGLLFAGFQISSQRNFVERLLTKDSNFRMNWIRETRCNRNRNMCEGEKRAENGSDTGVSFQFSEWNKML